jgi:Integrase core domain
MISRKSSNVSKVPSAHSTKPYTPKTNGKAERFIRTARREWAYARGVILVATHRTTCY